jgi:hypothetical protein
MMLSEIVFSVDPQPDFEALKKRGWRHPKGIRRGEVLTHSLVKRVGNYEIQIVGHKRTYWECTDAFVHPRGVKGQGSTMTVEEAKGLIDWLYGELKGAGGRD